VTAYTSNQKFSDCQSNSTPIYFWRGVADPQKLMEDERVQEVVLKLLKREYPKSDLEKLKSHNIYSIRTSRKERLLFTNLPFEGKNTLLILDFLPNHEYEKSKFLNSSVLKKFYIKQQEANKEIIWEGIPDNETEILGDCEKLSSDNLTFDYNSLDYYGSKFIQLSNAQGSVLTTSTPLIVNGAPGSGKSCAALSAIVNYLSDRNHCNGKKILYICSSINLASNMKAYWRELPSSEQAGSSEVRFISYGELIEEKAPEFNDHQQVTVEENTVWVTAKESTAWFKMQCKELNQKKKEQSFLSNKDQLLVFEEFQILSAYTKETYKKLGKRESLFHEPEKRDLLWHLYEKYTNWLKGNNKIDSRFFRFPSQQSKFDFTLVDEAADLSPLAISELYHLTDNGHIMYFLDTHQDLHNSLSKRIHFKKVLQNINSRQINSINLPHIYRCPKNIVGLANRWLDIKAFVIGGISDKDEYRKIDFAESKLEGEGRIQWTEGGFRKSYDSLCQNYKETEIAVIVESSKKEELKNIKRDLTLVFTPEEIKGLEFPAVLLYRLFDNESFKRVDELLNARSQEDLQKNCHRPKKMLDRNDLSNLVPEFNRLFTSLTRTEQTLTICQQSHRGVQNIKRLLLSETEGTPEIITATCGEACETSVDDWLEMAKKMHINGNDENFREICQNKLGKSPEEVLDLINPEQKKEKAVVTATVAAPCIKSKNKRKKRASQQASLDTLKKSEEAQKTPAKVMSTADKKLLVYINSLLKNFTENNIAKLLGNRQREHLLFEILDNSGRSLYDRIRNNEIKNKRFKKLLKSVKTLEVIKNGESKLFSLLDLRPNTIEKNGYLELSLAAKNGHKDIVELLLNKGAVVNGVAEDGCSALMLAAKNGHKGTVELLLNKGAVVNGVTEDGYSALILVAQIGHKDIVELLLNKDADVNAVTEDGCSALMLAAKNGHKGTVELLLNKGAVVNAVAEDGTPALLLAVQNGHKDIVELLLNKDADVNAVTEYGTTALLLAANNGHKDIVELLLNKDADVNAVTEDGYSVLMLATQNGHKDTVKLLLNKGAGVNAVEKDGCAVLIIAAKNGHKDIVELLLNKDAGVNAVTKDGYSALMIVAQNGHKNTVELLLNKDAGVNAVTKDGYSALMIAAQNGHKGTVELLLNKDAGVNAVTKDGYSALMLAAQNGHKDIVELVLNKDADVNTVTKNGSTALMLAAHNGHKDIVELLLNKDAVVNAVKKNDISALMYAVTNGHKDIVELLLNNGADVNAVTIDGYSALLIAAESVNEEMINLLLQNNAQFNVDATPITGDNVGKSILWFAVRAQKWNLVELMLAKSETINVNTAPVSGEDTGKSVLWLATESGDEYHVRELIKKANGVDISLKPAKGPNKNKTVLQLALLAGLKEIANLMLSKKLD
jgi:ankyrin repeat protein